MDEAKTVEAKPEHLEEYGCGPVQFSGQIDALFERHLRFDDIVDPAVAGARQKFEAAAHAVRDVLSQRWIETQQTYDRENPKRIYYLSMEFLIGRSLTNNVTNLTLHPFVERADREGALDWFGLVEQEPDAGLGQWRSRAAGRLLPRLDGDDAASGDGIRIALRIWHVPAVH